MSSSYSTMQQYAPLRVPSSFDQQGKALIVQLNETFDDIYRRFGRFRLEDMGKEFRQEWKTEQQTVITIGQNLDALVLKVRDKYDKVSGITIASEGIEISGSKYLKLLTGNTLEMQSGSEVKIMASGNANPAMTLDNLGIHMKTGGSINLEAGAGFTVASGNFAIDSSGNATFKGGGTFSGELSAASGTFKGTVLAGSVISCEISANQITSGAINANLITTGSLYADRISGGELNFNNFTVSNLSAGMITTGSLSASRISGGTLTLGGNGNANGKIVMQNASGTQIGSWDNSGLSAQGTLKSGNWNFDSNGIRYIPSSGLGFYLGINTGYSNSYGLSAWTSGNVESLSFASSRSGWIAASLDCTSGSNKCTLESSIKFDVLATNVSPGGVGTPRLGASNNYWNSAYITTVHNGSSRAIKRDIHPLRDFGYEIDQLSPVSFKYTNDEETHYGLIWEDTVGILPVICHMDEENKDTNKAKTITYMDLIPVLLKETQSLRKRVKALEAIA